MHTKFYHAPNLVYHLIAYMYMQGVTHGWVGHAYETTMRLTHILQLKATIILTMSDYLVVLLRHVGWSRRLHLIVEEYY